MAAQLLWLRVPDFVRVRRTPLRPWEGYSTLSGVWVYGVCDGSVSLPPQLRVALCSLLPPPLSLWSKLLVHKDKKQTNKQTKKPNQKTNKTPQKVIPYI